jgi:hypothetical protein
MRSQHALRFLLESLPKFFNPLLALGAFTPVLALGAFTPVLALVAFFAFLAFERNLIQSSIWSVDFEGLVTGLRLGFCMPESQHTWLSKLLASDDQVLTSLFLSFIFNLIL